MQGEDGATEVSGDSATLLLRAVYLRRLRLTRLLLEGGAYINESDRNGHTPLMVACRTRHVDVQSSSPVKIVKYLLEMGADPNIQDKEGRSALMHACREEAGTEVVSLLLAGGADLALEDRSGNSSLVYAVTAGDQQVLTLLLDTYKKQGKEVIIITTDQTACGKLEARQYLRTTPRAPRDPVEKTPSESTAAPASPSEVQLITSSSFTCSPKPVFSFKENKASWSGGVSSHPCSPTRLRGGLDRLQPQPLLRLNSEPWLKIPGSMCDQHVEKSSGDTLQDYCPKEKLFLECSTIEWDTWKNGKTSTPETPKISERGFAEDKGKMIHEKDRREKFDLSEEKQHHLSLAGIFSSHSTSHPNLHSQSPGTNPRLTPTSSFPCSKTLGNMAASSLHHILHSHNFSADHYSSDPQLTLKTLSLEESQQRAKTMVDSKKLVSSRSPACTPTFLGCGEMPELPPSVIRTALSGFERRGSGTFLPDLVSQLHARGSLPPLQLNPRNAPVLGTLRDNPHRPRKRDSCEKGVGVRAFLPSAPPGNPKESARRVLLRRHSMQTERLKNNSLVL